MCSALKIYGNSLERRRKAKMNRNLLQIFILFIMMIVITTYSPGPYFNPKYLIIHALFLLSFLICYLKLEDKREKIRKN